MLLLGIVAIAGGVFAPKRKVWGLALAGAICALFNWAGVLGILAIIFVAIAWDEFNKPPSTGSGQIPDSGGTKPLN